MDINPMMLLPLLMNNSQSGKGQDMTELLKMLTSMKSGSPDALMDLLPTNDKTKNLLSMIKTMQGVSADNPEKQEYTEAPSSKPRPNADFAGNEINRALNDMLKRNNKI